MQPERQISVALTIIGATLAAPEFSAIYLHHVPPRASLVVGALFGAIGAFFGSILAADHPAGSLRVLRLVVWTLIALAFSGAALFGAWNAATWGGTRTLWIGWRDAPCRASLGSDSARAIISHTHVLALIPADLAFAMLRESPLLAAAPCRADYSTEFAIGHNL